MRLRRPLFAALALTTLLLIACGGGDGDSDTTATLPPPPTTETPELLVDVPGRPNAFADWPGVVGIYLTVAGSAALAEPCLAELIAEWEMAEPDVPLTPEERCFVSNTDEDPEDEVVVLFTTVADDGSGLLSNVVVFDLTPDGYVPVFDPLAPDPLAR